MVVDYIIAHKNELKVASNQCSRIMRDKKIHENIAVFVCIGFFLIGAFSIWSPQNKPTTKFAIITVE